MNSGAKRLAILVGGGPAPGINSVISAVTIEAVNSGLEVFGIYDGFSHLMAGQTDMVRNLAISDVSRIHSHGGSILRTSRANPTRQEKDLQRVVQSLREMGVGYLVTIGGDDTAFSASEVARVTEGEIGIAHVPKTIDNDLPLPAGMPTFGFETARQVGTRTVLNLMEDSRTTNRWYFVVVMGRTAGHLALGIGKAAHATLTLIPEEFPQGLVSLENVARIIEGAMLKRRAMGRRDGVAVIAEGIATKLDAGELSRIPGVEVNYDPHGHIRLGEIPLASILRRKVQQSFTERDEEVSIVESTLGYELRSAPPVPFDIDYTQSLGYGAVRFLLSETDQGQARHSALVCLDQGHLRALPFQNLRDPDTGRTRVRVVDTQSDHYTAARQYMIRLEAEDLENLHMRVKLCEAAKMEPDQFDRYFTPAVTTVGSRIK
jgi:6-phosphofructokinase 1